MAQVIDPERLKQLRKLRGGTSQEKLAKEAGLNKQTVYRLENKGRIPRPVRKGNLNRLAQALGVDAEVLTGDKPIPSEVSQPSTPEDEAAYQLNVRVDAALRNAFELVARRYRISVPKIAQLAPLLFVIVAEGSLKHRRRKVADFAAALDRVSELESDFPHLPCSFFQMDDHETCIKAERASIERRDLFGQDRFDPYGETRSYIEGEFNPFVAYLKALTADRDDITVHALGPTSTEYRVCRSEAIELAGGDEQVAEWILNGEVPIHRMPRGLKKIAERIEWISRNKISVHKISEQIPEEIPLDPIDFDL